MEFAASVPLWLLGLAAAGAIALTYLSYRRPLVPLTLAGRVVLAGLRTLALGLVLFFLARPMVMLPPAAAATSVVPILIDVSRSMRVSDADGESRIAAAVAVVQRTLLPSLSARFTPEIYAIGDEVVLSAPQGLTADARRSDLAGALKIISERYRGRSVSGIVLVSDGADTEDRDAEGNDAVEGPPVFTVGVGSADGPHDREILGIVAGDPRLDQASVDLRVSAVSRGFGRGPSQLRLLANGRLLESRSIAPVADGSPMEQLFTVSPDPLNATVYTAEIATGPDETVGENNTASVLVSPAGRQRRILALNGAPGHEHSFMTRAISTDPGLEIDTVVRKGKNEIGQETYLVQAGSGRGSTLTSGFPSTREDLYVYDAIAIANQEGEFFTRAQLTQMAEFVSERGGGLLVLGGRSFAQRGFIGTPLEDVVPVELNDRRGLLRVSGIRTGAHNTVALTPEGADHPVMRIGATTDENYRRWSALPPLAASAPLGGPKAGASVLAVTSAPGGAVYPLIAVQRYGRGRSMIFSGEASWRWRMLQPATDQSYEYFWRGAMRWLGAGAPEQVTVEAPAAAEPGDTADFSVDVRDRAFQPVPDAVVEATVMVPGGETRPLPVRAQGAAAGRFTSVLRLDHAGLYRVRAEARRGNTALGTADRWFYVGGTDREFADPRMNEGSLRRIARDTNGQYVRAADASQIASWLEARGPEPLPSERRDLWHRPWAFALAILLLSAEWVLRRRWGLR